MTKVKVSHIDEVALATKAKQTPTIVATTPKPQMTKEDKEEEQLVAHSTALTTIIQRKKIPALTTYLRQHKLSPDFRLHPISTYSHASTLLHLASSSSLPTIVSHLLISLGASPFVLNATGKTPYEVSGDRFTRDRFRLARHILGEHKWNWDAAKVGKPLTEKEVATRDEKEKSDIEIAKAQKAAESKRVAEDALKASSGKYAAGKRVSHNNTIGGGGIIPDRVGDRGISEEMKVKIERERRARAAEARFATLSKN